MGNKLAETKRITEHMIKSDTFTKEEVFDWLLGMRTMGKICNVNTSVKTYVQGMIDNLDKMYPLIRGE